VEGQRHSSHVRGSGKATTPFAQRNRLDKIARLLVAGGSLFAAWQPWDSAPALATLLVSTIVSVAAGARRRGVMPRAILASSVASPRTHPGEDSPRLTSRGTTQC
jgi:hypothetical protein